MWIHFSLSRNHERILMYLSGSSSESCSLYGWNLHVRIILYRVLFGIPNSADVHPIDFLGLAWTLAVITSWTSSTTPEWRMRFVSYRSVAWISWTVLLLRTGLLIFLDFNWILLQLFLTTLHVHIKWSQCILVSSAPWFLEKNYN